ncbi:hypothetical protein [uncultured Sphingomonas sp.]|uniref:hypothetical protein n=1 Tax=uncultured Sphingomonas sp. TaxID=158754 RepID=UPI0026193AD1|nr:hypothetical protein [uncultured Sphingomonas sp.]
MIIFVAAALVASVSAKADTATICEVGRIALRDLPKINNNPSFDTYYAGVSRYHRDLLEACPTLVADLPVGYPLADDDARSRANLPAPIPGRPIREAFVYFIKPPKISRDRKTAIVEMGYFCTGLCGASFEVRYVKSTSGWRREGEIRNLFVS